MVDTGITLSLSLGHPPGILFVVTYMIKGVYESNQFNIEGQKKEKKSSSELRGK